MDADLIITFDPAHRGKAHEEVKTVLEEAGEEPKFLDSKVDGLFLLKIGKPKDVVKKLVKICKENPSKFEYTFRWIPIEKWCKSSTDEMTKVMKEVDEKIKPEESWKMDLSKRQYDEYGTTELIMKLTEHINKPKVDLKNPQKIVKVEIIGDQAGISLLNSNELLDVPKLKR